MPYSVQIKAKDTSSNLSSPSNQVIVIPVDKMPPSIPSGLKVASLGMNKEVTLTRNANTDIDLAGYELAYQKYGARTWVTQALEAETTSTTIEGLEHNIKFVFKIRAKDQKDNWSNYTALVTAIPKDQIAPDKPTGLTTEPSDRSVYLTWEANIEEDLGGYQLE
ncbi:fibronectin type III domain-containing protein [Desulfitobacterium sp. THU1]|uniref:fibronectin type III domain-containing protein n=1 Tax=Desulfitobacterium sp. THU1 TaxID=3138072 RepID=UPI00311EB341